MNADVIIGMDAGTLALEAVAFALEGNDINVARECHSDVVSAWDANAAIGHRADG